MLAEAGRMRSGSIAQMKQSSRASLLTVFGQAKEYELES
jgi:hypothetical protein